MNEVDLCLLLPLCVLYKMQNQIFQQRNDVLDARIKNKDKMKDAVIFRCKNDKKGC